MHPSGNIHTDIIIVGAGIVGTGLAAILQDTGLSCALVTDEPSNKEPGSKEPGLINTDPRIIALTPASKNILQAAKVWDAIAQYPLGYCRKMHVWDNNGTGQITFDSSDVYQDIMAYIVHQKIITQSMQTLLKKHQQLHWYQPHQIKSLVTETDKIHVELDNGERLSAKLLVAADGQSSSIRSLAGINFKTHDYQQQALACVVETELPHQQLARQIFLDHGPLAFLPMAEPHQCGVIWSTTPAHAATLQALDEKTFKHTLAEAFAWDAGNITQVGQVTNFPLVRAQAEQYCQPRLALVGDAAHRIHPLLGQGANLGLLDVACLAEIILQAIEQGKDMGGYATLRKYERWRKTENSVMIMLAEGFKYLFENKNTALTLLRNIGMNIVNSIPICKHEAMRRAMGLAGELPHIAKRFE